MAALEAPVRGLAALGLAVAAGAAASSAPADVLACQCGSGPEVDVYLMAPDGTGRVRLTDWRGEEGHPAFSPDGERLAFHADVEGNFEIYVMDLATRKAVRSTRDPARDIEPVWTRDGKGILFTSDRSGRNEIWSLDVATARVVRLHGARAVETQEADPSPDGTSLAFTQSGYVAFRWYVGVVDLATKASRILTDAGSCRPSHSPDGRALYYSRRAAGAHAIARLDLRTGASTDLLHTAGISYYDARPSPDGRRLAFHGYPYKRSGEARIYVMDAAGGAPSSVADGCAYPDWGRRREP